MSRTDLGDCILNRFKIDDFACSHDCCVNRIINCLFDYCFYTRLSVDCDIATLNPRIVTSCSCTDLRAPCVIQLLRNLSDCYGGHVCRLTIVYTQLDIFTDSGHVREVLVTRIGSFSGGLRRRRLSILLLRKLVPSDGSSAPLFWIAFRLDDPLSGWSIVRTDRCLEGLLFGR